MFKDSVTVKTNHNRVFRIPDGKRVYVIGDIHGRLDLLENLYTQIEADMASHASGENIVVHLGDYIDRGENSRGVIEFLLKKKNQYNCIFLRGNHEQGLLKSLKDPKELFYRIQALSLSYGIENATARDPQDNLADLKKHIPHEHIEFLEQTVISKIIGDYLFVHAGLNPSKEFEEQAEEDMLLIRDEFLKSDKDFSHKVVFGHSVFEEVKDYGNKIPVDTGAFATGKLSCLVLEGTEMKVLTT